MQLRSKKTLPGLAGPSERTTRLRSSKVLADKGIRVSGGGHSSHSGSEASEEDDGVRQVGESELRRLLARTEERERELEKLRHFVLNGEEERRPRERTTAPLPRSARVDGNSPPLFAVGSHQSYPSSGKPKKNNQPDYFRASYG